VSVLCIASNAVVAKLVNPDRAAQLLVMELLSYQVAGHEHMGIKNWDGRSSLFSFKTNLFPAGFVEAVRARLEKQGYVVQLAQKPLPLALGPALDVVENIDGFGGDPRYDYQIETVRRLERRGRMIAQIATGGGKSRICRLAYARLKRPTLFLTTRSILMYQMKKNIEKTLGIKVGVIGDGVFKPVKGFTVATVQTLAQAIVKKNFRQEVDKARFVSKNKLTQNDIRAIHLRCQAHNARREKVLKLLNYFEFVIGEEAHEAGGNQYYEVLTVCKNAHYRLALTATPFMREDSEDNMRLMAAFGSIGIKISEKMLIDRGILAKPYFKFISGPRPPLLYRTSSWPKALKIGIVENEWRNNTIVHETLRAAKYGLPTMILVQRKEHGKTLLKKLQAAGLSTQFIFGEHEQDQREAALKALESGRIKVLIGTTILDVGVDVPAVGLVILAGGGKAEVALRQRIGRGLREKKKGPNIAYIIDFADDHNKHLKGHALERRKIIQDTPGFAENILNDGQDFDYSLFEKAA
jgi:superfamily II DNA or RNA helicase